jgi:hypothetical protein
MPLSVKTFDTIHEAATALSSERGAHFCAGGTLVMRAVNEGDTGVSTLVRVKDRSLSQIRASGARFSIGSGVTLVQVLNEKDLAFLHPVVRSIGGPAVRNMGTVGGNLFAHAPFGDLAVALLALDAVVSVQGSYGLREIPMEEFLSGRDANRGTLVLSVSFERPSSPDAFRYRKVSRVKPKGASVYSIAVHLPNMSGRISGGRIAYGAMAPTAIRAKAAERLLEGKILDQATATAIAAVAAEGTSPATDSLASAWYRRETVGVHLRRLLLGQND